MNISNRLIDLARKEKLTPTTSDRFAPRVSGSWTFCQTQSGCRTGSTGLVWQKIQEQLTLPFGLGLFVLILIRMMNFTHLWTYLIDWLSWQENLSLPPLSAEGSTRLELLSMTSQETVKIFTAMAYNDTRSCFHTCPLNKVNCNLYWVAGPEWMPAVISWL